MWVVAVLHKLVCAVVALMVMAPPLLACALPGVEMGADEMACCRHMASECDDAAMPDSHSCCKKTPSAQTGALQTKQRDPALLDVVGQVAAPSVFVIPVVHVTAPSPSIFVFSESPPGPTSVLRI
jgi:hypothetical protein